jgi:Neuraminidase (sialidase)
MTAILVGSSAAGAAPNSRPVILPSVQVTTDINPARAYNQPQMLMDPQNPQTLVIAGSDYNEGTCGVLLSTDGGRTWTNRGFSKPPNYGTCVTSDLGPYLGAAFASDGTLHLAFTAAAYSCQVCSNDLVSATSKDLGATWTYAVIHKSQLTKFTDNTGATVMDMEHFSLVRMAVDPKNPNDVYVGARYGRAFRTCPSCGAFDNVPLRSVVATSTDGGLTWSSPVDVSTSMPRSELWETFIPSVTVSSDGTVFAFSREKTAPHDQAHPFKPGDPPGTPGAGGRKLMSVSRDHGKTWTTSTIDTSAVACGGGCDWPPVGISDPKTGNLYVVFSQNRTGSTEADILFIRSTDGGKTWTKPATLNDDQSHLDHFFPGISVAPDGRIDVAWFDFRDDLQYRPNDTIMNETYWDVYYTYSSDGGLTWSKNTRVSDRSMNENAGYTLSSNYGLMGPMGVASTNDSTYFAWSDSRAGTVDNPVEDYYFTAAVYNPASLQSVATKKTTREPGWLWALVGGFAVLIVVGIGLLGAARTR